MFGEHSLLEVGVFFAIVFFCLWLDLHAHKGGETISARNATMWSAGWIGLALAFAVYIWQWHGSDNAQLFLAGYFLEKSLSVDNLFVIMAIFGSFAIKDAMQHRILYYGVLGALVMRFVFVAAGTKLVEVLGPYALAGFGIFVLWTAWKMWQNMGTEQHDVQDYTHHWAVRFTSRFMRVTTQLHGDAFFVRGGAPTPADAANTKPAGQASSADATKHAANMQTAAAHAEHADNQQTSAATSPSADAADTKPANNTDNDTNALQEKQTPQAARGSSGWVATPLFLCLMVVELSDVMFAFDSVPAIIAITQDPFLVYTSNIFAILGLRSLYFLLAAAKRALKHLEKSVVAILVGIGLKMLLDVAGVAHVPPSVSLGLVAGLLTVGIVASLLDKREG